MEVLLVRAAVPFPGPRRSQKSAEVGEAQKSRAPSSSKFLSSDRPTENTGKSTVAGSSNLSVDPQTTPFASLGPLPAFPLKFRWFKASKKDDVRASTIDAAIPCGDVGSLSLTSAHDGITFPLSAEEKRTVHEVLSTLQSTDGELTPVEVTSLPTLSSDNVVSEVKPGAIASEDLPKMEAEIAKSWLHNFMRFGSLWNIKQLNKSAVKAPRKQSLNGVNQSGSVLTEPEISKTAELGLRLSDSISSEDARDASNCVCEECCVDSDDEPTVSATGEEEVTHIRVVHSPESFSRFLHAVPMAELKIVSHLSLLSNLAYVISTIKPGNLLRNHGLRFITSSIHIKAAEEKEAMQKAAQDKAAGVEAGRVDELEHSLTAAVGITKEVDVQGQDTRLLSVPLEPIPHQSESLPSSVLPEDTSNVRIMKSRSVSVAFDSSETKEIAPGSTKEIKKATSTDVHPVHCPCEWFICDDEATSTRNLAIQGSDSLASWQANLAFEPTRFEDPKFGVMVHRGIYDAAKILYDEVLPYVLEHIQKHGSAAKFRFTGHSLGGSLAILLSVLLRTRNVAPLSSLLPVYTFGSPYVFCGGDHLLQQLGFPQSHVQMVVMHRDIVPRSFTCDYPDHVAEVLRHVNGTFRDYACLRKQKLLYAPMGVMRVVQPPPTQAPGHPFLPPGCGMYDICHPSSSHDVTDSQHLVELRSAQRAFLNNPHPLDILRDRASYGAAGSISRDHDPRSYAKAVNYVLRQELRKSAKRTRSWFRLEIINGVASKKMADSLHSVSSGSIGAASSGMGSNQRVLRKSESSVTGTRSVSSSRNTLVSVSTIDRLIRYSRLIASRHVHIGMLLIVSARVLVTQGLATFVG